MLSDNHRNSQLDLPSKIQGVSGVSVETKSSDLNKIQESVREIKTILEQAKPSEKLEQFKELIEKSKNSVPVHGIKLIKEA